MTTAQPTMGSMGLTLQMQLKALWERLRRQGHLPWVGVGVGVCWLVMSIAIGSLLPVPPETYYTAGTRDRVRILDQAGDEVEDLSAHLVLLQGLWRQGSHASPLDAIGLTEDVYGRYHQECTAYTASACHAVMGVARASYSHVVSTDPASAAIMGQQINAAWQAVLDADRRIREDPLSGMVKLSRPFHPAPSRVYLHGAGNIRQPGQVQVGQAPHIPQAQPHAQPQPMTGGQGPGRSMGSNTAFRSIVTQQSDKPPNANE